MKILFFNELYTPFKTGGAEVSTQLLAEGLVQLGHDVMVCTTCNKNSERYVNGVHVVYIKIKNIYWPYEKKKHSSLLSFIWHIIDINNILYRQAFDNVFHSFKPDVIHTSNLSGFSCYVWKIAFSFKIPIVHTIRDYYLMCLKCTMFKNLECNSQCKECRLFSYVKKRLSHNVNAVVGISKFVLNKHLQNKYFTNAKIKSVINNPVGNGAVSNWKKVKTGNIGYIGSISSSKGVDLLVKAFSSIKSNEYKLLIAGNGNNEYIKYLKSLSNKDNIEFVGFVRSTDFFKNIDLLVVPSQWQEPFGRVVIEAISNGIPVIASKKGGITEILEGRLEGILFDDVNDLKIKLEAYMKGRLVFNFDYTASFGEKYKKNIIASQYEEIYKCLVE